MSKKRYICSLGIKKNNLKIKFSQEQQKPQGLRDSNSGYTDIPTLYPLGFGNSYMYKLSSVQSFSLKKCCFDQRSVIFYDDELFDIK